MIRDSSLFLLKILVLNYDIWKNHFTSIISLYNGVFILFWKWNTYSGIWDITSWYQSPCLGDSDWHSCESKLKLRSENFHKHFEKYFKKIVRLETWNQFLVMFLSNYYKGNMNMDLWLDSSFNKEDTVCTVIWSSKRKVIPKISIVVIYLLIWELFKIRASW